MICPVCNKDALIVEYHNIELDYCPACGGVWFDAGELEMMMGTAGLSNHQRFLAEMVNAPAAVTAEKKRKCPICRRKMKKTYIDPEKKIMVDVCLKQDGIWFDRGEVAALVKELAAGQGTASELLSFVGEMFKYKTV